MEIIIIVLLVVLIIKDYIPLKQIKKKQEAIEKVKSTNDTNTEEDEKIRALNKEFESIMGYSIRDAIKNKRGDLSE